MAAQEHTADQRWNSSKRIIAVLLLISPIDQIAFDLYAPALPIMGDEFAVANDVVQNTVTVYLLGMTLVVLPAGLVADAFGRKRLLLSGLGIVTVTGIGCAAAANLTELLALRFIQGIGAGTCLLLAATIAADCFRGAKLVSVLGLLGAAWGAAPVLAPAVGGMVVEFFSWRWVFVLLAAIAGLVAVSAAAALPETLAKERRVPIDARATVRTIGDALRHPVFVGFMAMFSLVAAAQAMFGVVAPFLYQDLLGFSAGAYGLIALLVGTANLLGALACSWLAHRTTRRRLALAAWALFMLGAATLSMAARLIGATVWAMTVPTMVVMLAIGVLDPLTKGLAMGVFTRQIGLVTGLITSCCYLVTTGAMALMAYLPEGSPEPLALAYLGTGIAFIVLLLFSMSRPAHAHPPRDLHTSLCAEGADD